MTSSEKWSSDERHSWETFKFVVSWNFNNQKLSNRFASNILTISVPLTPHFEKIEGVCPTYGSNPRILFYSICQKVWRPYFFFKPIWMKLTYFVENIKLQLVAETLGPKRLVWVNPRCGVNHVQNLKSIKAEKCLVYLLSQKFVWWHI